eukprot:TRINITY_DN5715_c0_g1_i1.p2 TRINITY_DN5715_c0_g1~~TRINITY_DN5715_c0_g1_i1.p2  ORF type:complete len:70 (-),score=15.45 TRINITY_DN5715_c0_g1_i1:112-321(-)
MLAAFVVDELRTIAPAKSSFTMSLIPNRHDGHPKNSDCGASPVRLHCLLLHANTAYSSKLTLRPLLQTQ